MVFNHEVLFIHLGKTGGMSVTNYLCNVLKPPVIHVVKKDEFENTKQSGHEVIYPWKRHANLVEADKFLKDFGIQLSDFKLIFCVVRNPLELDYSYYKHLRSERYVKTLSANPANKRLLAAANAEYEAFALQNFTHFKGKLKDFFEIDGAVPDNMKIVRFEELAVAVPELISTFAIKQLPFPYLNKSDKVKSQRPELGATAFDSVCKKYNWIFENYYPSLQAPSNSSSSIAQMPSIKEKKYLFIAGYGRSGTSELTRIIGSHSKIVLGLERYNKLMEKGSYSLAKDHFIKERFLNVLEGDTHYLDFNKIKMHHRISQKWDNSELFGLKYPPADKIFSELKKTFGNFHYIYIYRNVFDVAESWNRKAATDDKWNVNRNYVVAVKRWNQSLKTTLHLIKIGEPVICIKYEDLFFSDKSLEPVFEKFGLPIDENVLNALAGARNRAGDRKSKKGNLSQEEHDYVASNAHLDLLDKFDENYNIFRTKVEPGAKQKPKLILHIGIEKTGSTSIQSFLHLNRNILRKQGFAFLKSIGETNHNFLAMAHVSEDKTIEPVKGFDLHKPQVRKNWKEKLLASFKQEIGSLGDQIKTVVISSEHFSSLLEDIKELKALQDLFSDYFSSIRIIVYLRRQDMVAVSRRSTAYLVGYMSKLSDFKNLNALHFCHYFRLLNMWQEAMPDAMIIPRVFDRAEFTDNSLISDFMMCAGIEKNKAFTQPKVLNVTLSKSAMDAAMFYDMVVDKGFLDMEDEALKEFRLKMIKSINLKFPGPGKKPSRSVARKFFDQYKSCNQSLDPNLLSRRKGKCEILNIFDIATLPGKSDLGLP